MKVLLFNGSPNKEGCTYTALTEIAKTLNEEGIETEIYHVENEPIASCKGCRACEKRGLRSAPHLRSDGSRYVRHG